MPWKRPEHNPVGKVWMRFKGEEKDGVSELMYQIRDMDEVYRVACLELMRERFLQDEPVCEALGAYNDKMVRDNIENVWNEKIDQNICIACFTEVHGEPVELVGFNLLFVACKEDNEEKEKILKELPNGEVLRKIVKTMTTIDNLVDAFSVYDTDAYLSSFGLVVLPTHRGQNIGARLLEVRAQICKELDIKATCTIFTATASQILAAKCGFEVLGTLQYADMMRHGIDLTHCKSPCAKLMGIKYR